MNEFDKEKLIEKDIKSIENRVRHAFNQGYEAGLKHGKEQEPKTDTWSIKDVADTLSKHGLIADQEPCDDAISRQAVLDGIEELKKSSWATDKRGNGFEYLITEALDVVAELCVKQEPSVNPKSDVLDLIMAEIDREYKWLMNTRYTIHDVNIAFGYILGIIDKYKERIKCHNKNCTDCILDLTDACSRGAGRAVDDEICEDFLEADKAESEGKNE